MAVSQATNQSLGATIFSYCVSTMSRVATKDVNIAASKDWKLAGACNLQFRKALSVKPFDKYLNTIYVNDSIWGQTGAWWPLRNRTIVPGLEQTGVLYK